MPGATKISLDFNWNFDVVAQSFEERLYRAVTRGEAFPAEFELVDA
jgi:hypothetical protein